jgi:hypothetical protein
MAISAINQHRNELAKQFIDGSQLNADTKADLDEMLDSSLRTTNGLKPEEKLDAISDNLYQLTRLTCIHIAETPKTASWKDVIIKCRREITIIGLGIITLLVLRPQIADIVEHILRH